MSCGGVAPGSAMTSGTARDALSMLVSWPEELAPQHATRVSASRAHAWFSPAASWTTFASVPMTGVVATANVLLPSFVMGYSQGSDTSKLPKPGNVEPSAPPEDYSKYEQLKAGMSDDEIKAAIERSKAKNAAANGSGGSDARSGSSAP